MPTSLRKPTRGESLFRWPSRLFFLFPAEDPEEIARLTVDVVARRIPARFGLDPRRDVQVHR